MGFVANVVSGLRALMGRTRAEQEMDEELGSFLEASRADKRRAGMTPEQAAHLIEALLLEEGIPSMSRRSGGFDVPDFLAAGPRDILVPESGAEAAREAGLEF